MNLIFSFIFGFIIGIITINLIFMKTTTRIDEEYKTVYETVIPDQKGQFKIVTSETFNGLKSKLFLNTKFEKDLEVRNLNSYPDQLKQEIHINALHKFLINY